MDHSMKVAASVVKARREQLAQRIASEGYLHLGELCRKMGVSVATARRDLAHLHAKGRIARIRGGAMPHRGAGREESVPRAPRARAANDSAAALSDSSGARLLKEEICEIGRRLWLRGLVDGATGHLSARLGNAHVLCTPAGVSRGFMRPNMLCLVDLEGNQVASHGQWKRSPEVLVDLAIYRAVPDAGAVAHAHPPHATAFSISGLEPPRGLLPEFEVFAGPLVRADYRMPGSLELAMLVGKLAPDHQSILLKNHGVICWGTTVQDASFKLEMTESYCHTVAVAARLPGHQTALPPDDLLALQEVKRRLGIPGVPSKT